MKLVAVDDTNLNGHADQEPAPNTWRPANLVQLAANPPEPPSIGGLLYPGLRTVLSGETESMKTWLALILAKAEIEAGFPVVWVDPTLETPCERLNVYCPARIFCASPRSLA